MLEFAKAICVLIHSPWATQVLISSAELAAYLNVSELVDGYSSNATSLKTAFNDAFWSSNVGMYRNNLTSTLYPQDANSLAVLFNLTTSAKQASSVSAGLTQYWGEFGSVSPELPDTVTPYIGSFEVGLDVCNYAEIYPIIH